MSLSKYTSTTETTNLARVARLILGPCTEVLRDILRKEIPPSSLSRTVRNWVDHQKNQNAKNPLSRQQTDLIFPPPTKQYGGNYSDFDVTILYLLLRNVCNITEHTVGWGIQPNPGDRSVSANIERIRLIRNKYYGHTSDFSLTESDFRQEWRNICDIVVELECYLGTTTVLQDSVYEIKTCSMDPDLEKKYIDKLLAIDKLQKTVKSLSDDIKKLHCVIPVHVKAQHNTEYIRKWTEEDSVFVETHGFPEMLQRVRDQPFVTFVGVPGSGKSATAQHIALLLQKEGYEVVPVLDFRDLTQYCDPQNPQVFVINDVIGVLGVQKAKLDTFLEYEQRITQPAFKKSKVVATCRETLFNQCYTCKSFFTYEQNVIKLHSSEYVLSVDDQRNILEKHGLGRDLLSPTLLTEASRMFPLLCKLYSNEEKFRRNGVRFFATPTQCIVKEFDKMQQRNNLFYASLVLCTLNNSIMSKDILNDEQNDCFQKMKQAVLENCEVESNTDTFKFVKALSAMEGTYTKRHGIEFTFVHDSMFEITAYHFGRQFPELILEYLRSSYIANYVKLQTYVPQNENNSKSKEKSSNIDERNNSYEATGTRCVESSENREAIGLCIQVPLNLYPVLAERLYRDIKNMELYDVFMNDALKDHQLCKIFIDVLKKKSYTELISVFLYKQENVSNCVRMEQCPNKHSQGKNRIEKNIENLMVDKREISFDAETYNVRVISWVTYYGHHQILKYILDQTELHNETKSILFVDFVADIGDFKNKRGQEEPAKCKNNNVKICVSDSLNETCMSMNQKQRSEKSATVEQTRLFVLSCYGGDVETVRILLKYVDLNSSINRTPQHRSDRKNFCIKDTPLTAACLFGHLSVVKVLLEVGADVNVKGLFHTPLIAACIGGHLSVVKELCKKGAKVNLEGKYETPLTAACKGGHRLVVKELLNFGASINLERLEDTPLTAACTIGHLNIVNELLQSGAIVNQKTHYKTPLISACSCGELSVIRKLLRSGADINLQCFYDTPLTAACGRGHLVIVKELLKAGAIVNPKGLNNTPLNAACREGHFNVVNELLKVGADVNQQDSDGTPLIIACFRGHANLIKTLLKAKVDVNRQNNEGNTALLISIQRQKDNSIIKGLIEAGADVHQPNNVWYTPLAAACGAGNLSLVKDLLGMGAIINPQDLWYKYENCARLLKLVASFQGIYLASETFLKGLDENHITPLTAACRGGHLDVVKELLEKGADVNPKFVYNTPLTAACDYGQIHIVKELIKYGIDVNFNPWQTRCWTPNKYKTPLTVACENGNLKIVRELLNAKSDLNPTTVCTTPLIAACAEGHERVVRELLSKGADVNLQGRYSTPLKSASFGRHAVIVKQLLNVGAIVNQTAVGGETPLASACRKWNADVVKELLEAGANVNLHKQEGWTPLYIAVCNDEISLSALKMLITYGADCTLHSYARLSPMYIALIQNKMNVLKLFQQSKTNQQLKKVNLHLFNILVDIRHADIVTDGRDDVVIVKKKVWNVENDWFGQIFRAKCDVLRHLLCIGLDSNQTIRIRNRQNEVNVKPLLFRIIDNEIFVLTCREEILKILLEAGADVNVRVKYRESNSALNRMGVSALERTRQLICEQKNSQYTPEIKRYAVSNYQKIIKEIKKHVRRYSI